MLNFISIDLKSISTKILLILIRNYKTYISPLLPPSCRFQPTCSEYMLEAIERFGPLYGTLLGIKRIFRCNPFSVSRYDPVPLKVKK
ncbi:MAG: membrane protein insertion efficiency factor YidD [Candidatus Atelocyanobacterium thalassa]